MTHQASLVGLIGGCVVAGVVFGAAWSGKDRKETSPAVAVSSGPRAERRTAPPRATPTPKPVAVSKDSAAETSLPAALTPVAAGSRETPVVRLARQVSPAVVAVGGLREAIEADPFFGDLAPFFAYRHLEKDPFLGSGFVVNSDGWVVTNLHVIEGAQQVFVTLADGREFDATLLDADRFTDIAILRVNGKDLPWVEIGNSDQLMIGETAVAFGNPFGSYIEDPRPTITVGVVSALSRSFRPDPNRERVYFDMIQTDAAINPGNSGGPLVTLDGKVAGMNTFIVSTSGGSVGLGFAIPANRIRSIIEEVRAHGRLRPLRRDFFYLTLTRALAARIGVNPIPGAVIYKVEPKSPAEAVGLKAGDIVVRVDTISVRTATDLRLHIAARQIGDTLELGVVRQGTTLTVKYTIQEGK